MNFETYQKIKQTVEAEKKCSISYIQRRHNLNYADTRLYIDHLIRDGIVTENMEYIHNQKEETNG